MTRFLLQSDIQEICTELGDVANDFSGKTILLAGGRGFLGRYFTAVFNELNCTKLEKPCELIVLDNLITAGAAGTDVPDVPHCRFVKADISKPVDFDEPVDYVIHAAGIASPHYYRANPLETIDVAVNGQRNLLEIAKKYKARTTFFSSSEIYGDPDPKFIPIPETYNGNVKTQGERSCYDESKRLGETLSYVYHTKYGVTTNVIRPYNVIGPGMQELDYRVLPNFASKVKAGKPLQVYGGGLQTRTFCYVTDAINGFLRVIARGVPGETYNIGNPNPEISMMELVLRIAAVVSKPIEHKIIDYPSSYPADEPNRRCPDISKATAQVGYVPKVDLNVGLKRFFDWTEETYSGIQ